MLTTAVDVNPVNGNRAIHNRLRIAQKPMSAGINNTIYFLIVVTIKTGMQKWQPWSGQRSDECATTTRNQGREAVIIDIRITYSSTNSKFQWTPSAIT